MPKLTRMLPMTALGLAIVLLPAELAACYWARGYFHQVTDLRGRVVGRSLGPLQYWRWLRQRFDVGKATLTLYEYRDPISSLSDMPLVKRTTADGDGRFDFGPLEPGHYTLIVEKGDGYSDWFDVQVITPISHETESVTIDVSPHFPDCEGGHEFMVRNKPLRN